MSTDRRVPRLSGLVTSRHTTAGTGAHAAWPRTLVLCVALVMSVGLSARIDARAQGPRRVARPAAAGAAAPVAFPGPDRGALGSQTPRASDFFVHCNSALSTSAGAVGGMTIVTGTALVATGGCGMDVLVLDAPGAGHFRAIVGVADDEPSGTPATVRVRVTGRDGRELRGGTVTATRGHTGLVDVDVSQATAVTLRFVTAPKTYLYGFQLTGSARTLQPVRGSGAPAVGARALDLAGAVYSCNAHRGSTSTTPLTVARVSVPNGAAATATGCGQVALTLPAGARGTLALRYGDDDSSSTGGRDTLSVRVLDASGQVIRKAIGAASLGAAMRPLWVDVTGGRSVVLAVDGATDSNVVVTNVGLLPRALPAYAIANRVIRGSNAGGGALIDPVAFVSKCNSYVGSQDTTVGGASVLAGTYFATYACGTTNLLFCNACSPTVGVFHARFGVPDSGSGGGGKQPTATVIVKDKDNHVLRQVTVRAPFGSAGAPIAVNITRASVLSFSFGGTSGVLYDLRLTGTATVSEYIYPPTNPPVSLPGGVAVNPRAFGLSCNAYVADQDIRVVNATSLEGWALQGEACGQALLPLGRGRYPRHTFAARIGIAVGEAPSTNVTVRFNVLNKAGAVIRHTDVTALFGYGWQPARISLAGGSALQIVWARSISMTVVFAMTAA